jgi:peptidoglycan/xylan/chitin deacetylase (PgdA/CDA1 family)
MAARYSESWAHPPEAQRSRHSIQADDMRVMDRALGAVGHMAVGGLSASTGPTLSILIFHRVAPTVDPMFPAEMDAARFDRLMALIARSFQVMPLADAADRLEQRTLPPRAMCITFDDGYADNHDVALPILRRHGLSACFFIATGFLDGGRMFNDTVIECIRRSTRSRIDLGEFGLGVVDPQTSAQRAAVVDRLLAVIKFRPPVERLQALERLQRLCQPTALPDDLMMTGSQVRGLHAAGMEIGAHTVTHPILCKVTDSTAEQEIIDSRNLLESLIDRPVRLFAYPNGLPDRDFAYRHAEMVRRHGFVAAVSTAEGVAAHGDDRYQMPRVNVWGNSPWTWIARLVGSRRRREFATARPPSSG